MTRVYEFNNPQDMIDLAQKVQTEVYWNGYFRITEDNEVMYKYFWEYCDQALYDGFTKVEITSDNKITFRR